MFKKYFLILLLSIFSFNVVSANIEHNCHEEMIQVEKINKEDCHCCEDEEKTVPNVKSCDCDNCEFTQSFFVNDLTLIKNIKHSNNNILENIKLKLSISKNMYKPPIFI